MHAIDLSIRMHVYLETYSKEQQNQTVCVLAHAGPCVAPDPRARDSAKFTKIDWNQTHSNQSTD